MKLTFSSIADLILETGKQIKCFSAPIDKAIERALEELVVARALLREISRGGLLDEFEDCDFPQRMKEYLQAFDGDFHEASAKEYVIYDPRGSEKWSVASPYKKFDIDEKDDSGESNEIK